MKFSSATLACFVQVCQHRGFSQAAEKLGKSQSAISTQVAQLEKEVGIQLIDRSNRPLLLTEAGQLFLDFARDVLNKSESFERYLSEFSSGIAGEVRVGASTSVGTHILPGIISDVLRRFPNLKISLLTQARSLVFESVRRGDVDFGLVLSYRRPEGLAVQTLKREPLWFFISPKHALAKRRSIKLADLHKVPFVVGPKGTEYTEMISRVLSNHDLSAYQVTARISNFDGLKELVRAGHGIGLLPRFVVRREIREGHLDQVKVRGFNATADIMRVESFQHLSTPTITRIKEMITSAVLNY
jgi:DNA-binding transcriptional LysR family regulator